MTDPTYEIGIIERMGPLLRIALEDLDPRDEEARTLLVGCCDDPTAVLRLVRRLHELGLEVDHIRLDCITDLPPSAE